jgi:hypothetical protein
LHGTLVDRYVQLPDFFHSSFAISFAGVWFLSSLAGNRSGYSPLVRIFFKYRLSSLMLSHTTSSQEGCFNEFSSVSACSVPVFCFTVCCSPVYVMLIEPVLLQAVNPKTTIIAKNNSLILCKPCILFFSPVAVCDP